MRDGHDQARTRRLEQALNFAMGYLTALGGWAEDEEQRYSATRAVEMLADHIAPTPAAREQDEDE